MLLAQNMIKEDPKLKEIMLNDAKNPPKFSIEELEKLDRLGNQSAETGFAFYVDNDS